MISEVQFIRILTLFCILVSSTSVIQSQVTRPQNNARPDAEIDVAALGSIRGRVLTPGGNYISASVKVTLQTLRETVAVVFTENQGQFEFAEVRPGNYQLEIDPTDRQQFDVSIEAVQVFKGMPSVVTLVLKEKKASETKRSSDAKTVSAIELDRGIPSNARKEFAKASKFSREGKTEEAIYHLRRAIAFHPNFVMAHNDLGTQLLAQGKLNEAAQELRTAITLDPNSFNPTLNLGIVLTQQQRFSEAVDLFGKALSIEPGSPAARLYSGICLMALAKFEAAELDLKTAYKLGGAQYSLANFHLGQLYMNTGARELALKSFELYLKDIPSATNADQVQKLIAILR
jgi:tetratricopeptide (TPR) repeat protein